METNTRNEIIDVLLENHGKSFTIAQFAETITGLTTRQAFEALDELKEFLDVSSVPGKGKGNTDVKFLSYSIKDNDQMNAVDMWQKFREV